MAEAVINDLKEQINEMRRLMVMREATPVPAYETFTFVQSEWNSWITGYEKYREATGIKQLTEKQQINQLLLQMGSEVDKIMENAKKKQENFPTYLAMKEFFEKVFERKINIIFERAKFNLRNQNEGESAEQYIQEIINLAKLCNYGALNDELIRDRLVVGIRDTRLSEELQMDKELNMEKAIEQIKQAETVRQQNSDLKRMNGDTIGAINSLYGRKWKNKKQAQEDKNAQDVEEEVNALHLTKDVTNAN